MNKNEIMNALNDAQKQFDQAISGLADEEMQQPGAAGEWSVKDIISHLGRWEAEMVRMLWQIQQGQKPDTEHFSGRQVDEINAEWSREMKSRPLAQALSDYKAVRTQTIKRLQAFSDQDLSDPDRYPALRGQPLENWIVGDSSDHQAEHAAQIREWRQKQGSG